MDAFKLDHELNKKPSFLQGCFFVDITLFSVVASLAFLSISKSIGYPYASSYFESLLGSDKILHMLAGFVIPLFIVRMLLRVKRLSLIKSILIGYLIASLIMITDEGLQYFNAHRHVSIDDLMAGFYGLLLSVITLVFLAVIAKIKPKYK